MPHARKRCRYRRCDRPAIPEPCRFSGLDRIHHKTRHSIRRFSARPFQLSLDVDALDCCKARPTLFEGDSRLIGTIHRWFSYPQCLFRLWFLTVRCDAPLGIRSDHLKWWGPSIVALRAANGGSSLNKWSRVHSGVWVCKTLNVGQILSVWHHATDSGCNSFSHRQQVCYRHRHWPWTQPPFQTHWQEASFHPGPLSERCVGHHSYTDWGDARRFLDQATGAHRYSTCHWHQSTPKMRLNTGGCQSFIFFCIQY